MKVIRDENNHLKDNNTEVDETKIDFNILYIYIYLNI
jgi:hypothetical protein